MVSKGSYRVTVGYLGNLGFLSSLLFLQYSTLFWIPLSYFLGSLEVQENLSHSFSRHRKTELLFSLV